MPRSIELHKKLTSGGGSEKTVRRKKEFFDRWPDMERVFRAGADTEEGRSQRDAFLRLLDRAIQARGHQYLSVITSLPQPDARAGTAWLQGIVDRVVEQIAGLLPSFDLK
jgi:hypothetical protein